MPEIGAPSGRDWVACVPVGAHEQHGPHLPLDTDTRIAVAVAHGAARAARVPVWVGPAVTVSSSAEHDGFPGTVSLSEDTTVDVLVQIACSLTANAPGCAAVVFANAHGGNAASLRRALGVLAERGVAAFAWLPSADGADAHAGRTETSVMLAIAPDTVDMAAAEAGEAAPLAEIFERLRREGVKSVSTNGVLGDPTGAGAAEGVAILAEWVASLAAVLEESRAPTPGRR